MGGPLEIEVKFYLAEIHAVRERILAMGAASIGRVFETNICFDDGPGSLKAQGNLLRLRKDQRITLTFKSRPASPDKDFKIHHELELQVDDFDTCRAILEGLGFHPAQTYEKWRETYMVSDTQLLVDTTPYGIFLEIEGEKSNIRHIAEQLGLQWQERISLNYLEIFHIIQQEENLPFHDMTFDGFKLRPVDIKKYLPLLYAG